LHAALFYAAQHQGLIVVVFAVADNDPGTAQQTCLLYGFEYSAVNL